jgi:hypothetical protein
VTRWTTGPSGLRTRLAPTEAGALIRQVQRDGEDVTLRRLARDYPARSSQWDWLREHGVARPRVGGPGGAESRRTVAVKLRLPPESAEALAWLAAEAGAHVSALIVRWISEKSASHEKST